MDSERFGRALGFGARAAAKTLVTAMDAASAPNPKAKQPAKTSGTTQAAATKPAAAVPTTATSTASRAASAPLANGQLADQVTRAATQVFQASQQVNQQKRQLQQSVLSPVKRLSGVLWLEFTGFFFGLFAVSAASAVWKLRDALHETPQNHDAHVKLLMAAGMSILFAYFCVSSFVRAKKRERAR